MLVSSLGHYEHQDFGGHAPRDQPHPATNKAQEACILCWLPQSSLTGRHQIAIWLSLHIVCVFPEAMKIPRLKICQESRKVRVLATRN